MNYEGVSSAYNTIRGKLVFVANPAFSVVPVDMTASAGSSATFECLAIGDPEPTVTWSRGADEVTVSRFVRVLLYRSCTLSTPFELFCS